MSLARRAGTEQEMVLDGEIQLFRLAQLARKEMSDFSEVSKNLPCYVTISRTDSLDITFANAHLEYLMEVDQNTMVETGFSLIREISHDETLKRAIGKIELFNKTGDEEAVCSYLQCLKFHNRWQWVQTYKHFLNDRQYINMGIQVENLGAMGRFITNILNETLITQNGWQKFQSLTRKEKEILKLIASGLTNKEIGERLFVSDLTVKTHRQNIMQKLAVKHLAEMIRFAHTMEIIDECDMQI